MQILADAQDMANASGGFSVPLALIIALVGSSLFMGVIWKLGVIRFMVNIQNQRQARTDEIFDELDNHPESFTEEQKKSLNRVGRKRLQTYEWGTGRHATISFTSVIWLLSFCFILFGLIIYG